MKKLIPAVVLLAAVGAAQAQVTVYGLIDMSYGKNIADDAAGVRADFHSGGDAGSSQGNSTTRIGVKGTADVGKGYKGNFQLESGGITSNGSVGAAGSPFFARQAWVGLSAGFGEVRLGTQDSVPFQTMVGFDFNGAANAASAQGNVAAAPWMTGRQERSLQYISPSMSGFKAQVGFVPRGTVVGAEATTSLGLSYAAGKLTVAATAESKRTTVGDSFGSVAASYDFGAAKVMAAYANAGTNMKGTSLGVVAPVAGFNIGMNYTKNSDTQAVGTEFYVNREIFKNTYGYLDFGNVDKTTATSLKGSAYAVGVIYTF